MNINDMTLEQLKALETELKGQVPSDVVELNRVQSRITELEQQAAEKVKIQDAAVELVSALDTLDFGGLTLRQVIGSEDGYQLVTIELKKAFISQADEFSKQLLNANEQRSQLQTSLDTVNAKVQEQAKELDDTNRLLNEEKFARTQAEQYRDNAAKQLEEAKKEVERLNSQVDDLRKEIAVGAREAYKVVDTEEEARKKKELADKIRVERTVYDVVPDDTINPRNYTAKLVATDEPVKYNWTKQNYYIELKDENEILQFRQQHGQSEPAKPNTTEAAAPVQDSVTPTAPEATFPVPSAKPPEVPNIPTTETVDLGHASTAGESGKTVEERLTALEAHVFGNVKGQVA